MERFMCPTRCPISSLCLYSTSGFEGSLGHDLLELFILTPQAFDFVDARLAFRARVACFQRPFPPRIIWIPRIPPARCGFYRLHYVYAGLTAGYVAPFPSRSLLASRLNSHERILDFVEVMFGNFLGQSCYFYTRAYTEV